jgi:hypothetical protein
LAQAAPQVLRFCIGRRPTATRRAFQKRTGGGTSARIIHQFRKPQSSMNLTPTIVPKSSQLNADDLITGTRTITITRVDAGSAEQPVQIHYEGGDGRPYLPSKSMRRVLVHLWGSEGDAYVGRKLVLYRDPLIKFGGDPVGGIRISHASDIAEPVQIALTETRGKRKPFRVEPFVTPTVDVKALTVAGNASAEKGTEALRGWWSGLNADERLVLKDALTAWKETAAKAGK